MKMNFEYQCLSNIIIATARPTLKKSNLNPIYLSSEEQTTSDLGFEAAKQVIKDRNIDVNEIGGLLFLTRTADYRGPATSMVLQNRLGIPKDCVVFDIPTGNSGFEVGLHHGTNLLASVSKKYVLVILGDTTSKLVSQSDFENLEFQDAASAMILQKDIVSSTASFHYITLSDSWQSILIPDGGFRKDENLFVDLPNKRLDQQPSELHFDLQKINETFVNNESSIYIQVKAIYEKVKSQDGYLFLNLMSPELEEKILIELGALNDQRVKASTRSNFNAMSANTPLMLFEYLATESSTSVFISSISLGEGLAFNFSSFYINCNDILNVIYSDSSYTEGSVSHEI